MSHRVSQPAAQLLQLGQQAAASWDQNGDSADPWAGNYLGTDWGGRKGSHTVSGISEFDNVYSVVF